MASGSRVPCAVDQHGRGLVALDDSGRNLAAVGLWRHPGTNDEAARAVFGFEIEQLWSEWLATLG
jgi:hypothetical protein